MKRYFDLVLNDGSEFHYFNVVAFNKTSNVLCFTCESSKLNYINLDDIKYLYCGYQEDYDLGIHLPLPLITPWKNFKHVDFKLDF